MKQGPEKFSKWLQEQKGGGKGKTKGKGKQSWNDRSQPALPEQPVEPSG